MATAWPTFDVAEIAQEASERAGIELRTGYSLRTARRALELLSIEWANRGLNLWTIEGPLAIDLLPDQDRYPLADDTVDIIEAVLRSWWSYSSTEYTDYPLDRMTLPEYTAITNKLARGRPSIFRVQREIHPYALIWMVPGLSTNYQLVYWRLRRMAPLGAGGVGIPEVPWRFVPAMIAGLAYHMALKSTQPEVFQRVETLKGIYEEQFTLASDEDRDRATFRFVPGGYERI